MKYVYAIRRSQSWKNFVIDIPRSAKFAEAWDKVFNISYIDFRKSLSKIREENFRRCKHFDEVIDFPSERANFLCKNPSILFFPTDDDDWFHDDIIELVSNVNLTKKNLRWRYLEYGPSHVFKNLTENKSWMPYFNYQTNNAVFSSPIPNLFLESHFIDLNYSYPFTDEQYSDENWLVHNKTFASRSYWHKTPTEDELMMNYEFYRDLPCNVPEVYLKYIDMLSSLISKLKNKKIKLL